MARLLGVGRERSAMRHIAEWAAARAAVAEDHESRRALAEALGDVRARGLFAHRVQALLAQDPLDLVEARVRARRTHPHPRRLCERRRNRHAADCLRPTLFPYAY